MTEEPLPPENPTPGWYQDPSGEPGYRWWDGTAWTSSVAPTGAAQHDMPPPSPAKRSKHNLGIVGEWLQETIRSVVRRAGHYLPMVLIFSLPLGLIAAVPTWYALTDVAIVTDPEAGTFEVENFEWSIAVFGVIGMYLVSMLASFVLAGAVSHQAIPSADDEAQHQWSTSFRHSLKRSPRIVGYSLARTLTYLLPTGALGLLTVFVSPSFIVAVFMLVPVFAVLWVRLSMVDVAASVGPNETNPFKVSWALTGPAFFPLLGRLLLLMMVGFVVLLMFVIVGQSFVTTVAGGSSAAELEPNIIRFSDVVLPSVSLLALSSFFSSLGSGFRDVVFAAGGTKLYQRLQGPIEQECLAVRNDS